MDIQKISDTQFTPLVGITKKEFEVIYGVFYTLSYERLESKYLNRKYLHATFGMRKAKLIEPDEGPLPL